MIIETIMEVETWLRHGTFYNCQISPCDEGAGGGQRADAKSSRAFTDVMLMSIGSTNDDRAHVSLRDECQLRGCNGGRGPRCDALDRRHVRAQLPRVWNLSCFKEPTNDAWTVARRARS